jgi:hypothetical protein
MSYTELWFRIWFAGMVALSYGSTKTNQSYLESIYSQSEQQAKDDKHRHIQRCREVSAEGDERIFEEEVDNDKPA